MKIYNFRFQGHDFVAHLGPDDEWVVEAVTTEGQPLVEEAEKAWLVNYLTEGVPVEEV